MEIELYIKEEDQNNGQCYLPITPDGKSKIELFNIINSTQCPDGLTHLQPLRFYTSDKLINYMNDVGMIGNFIGINIFKLLYRSKGKEISCSIIHLPII